LIRIHETYFDLGKVLNSKMGQIELFNISMEPCEIDVMSIPHCSILFETLCKVVYFGLPAPYNSF